MENVTSYTAAMNGNMTMAPPSAGKPLIAILIIVGNLVVVISSGLILKKKQEPRSTYLLLGNLALADLMCGVLLFYIGIVHPTICSSNILHYSQLVLKIACNLTSIYSVGLIAVDRFLYILYGMKYASWLYPTRTRIMIAVTWLCSFLIGLIHILRGLGDHNRKVSYLLIDMPPQDQRIISLIAMAPLPVIIVLYSIILYHALRKISQLKSAETPNPHDNLRIFVIRGTQSSVSEATNQASPKKSAFGLFKKQSPKITPSRLNAIKIVILTTGSMIVTWFPYFLALFIFGCQCSSVEQDEKCKSFSEILIIYLPYLCRLNNLMNPILYAWWHKGFRKFVKKKLNMLRKTERKKNNLQHLRIVSPV